MDNNNATGKFIIIKDLNFSDYFKDEDNKIKIFDSEDEAFNTCGMYEFEDVLVLKVIGRHQEPEE
jgi:hypothetical protein